jgi:hypothetical protein
MPVILATQEADIRKIVVPSQPRENSSQALIMKKPITKEDWWSGSSEPSECEALGSNPSTTKKKGSKLRNVLLGLCEVTMNMEVE